MTGGGDGSTPARCTSKLGQDCWFHFIQRIAEGGRSGGLRSMTDD
jgi:hypothetical protein